MTKLNVVISLLLFSAIPAVLTILTSTLLGSNSALLFCGALFGGCTCVLCFNLGYQRLFMKSWSVMIQPCAFLAGALCASLILGSLLNSGKALSLGFDGVFALCMAFISFFAFQKHDEFPGAGEKQKKWLRVAWFAGIIATAKVLHLVGLPWRDSFSSLVMGTVYLLVIDPRLHPKDAD